MHLQPVTHTFLCTACLLNTLREHLKTVNALLLVGSQNTVHDILLDANLLLDRGSINIRRRQLQLHNAGNDQLDGLCNGKPPAICADGFACTQGCDRQPISAQHLNGSAQIHAAEFVLQLHYFALRFLRACDVFLGRARTIQITLVDPFQLAQDFPSLLQACQDRSVLVFSIKSFCLFQQTYLHRPIAQHICEFRLLTLQSHKLMRHSFMILEQPFHLGKSLTRSFCSLRAFLRIRKCGVRFLGGILKQVQLVQCILCILAGIIGGQNVTEILFPAVVSLLWATSFGIPMLSFDSRDLFVDLFFDSGG